MSKKIRVADYIASACAQAGINTVFMVTGGGAMHLNDAIGRQKKINYVACHHEQACSMAAESYFRATGQIAAVNVTTGPGGTNALTGVYGAFVDSIGMIVLSGQVKWETLVRSTDLPLRQLGDQEVDIISMAKPITKFAEIVRKPEEIRYILEKALFLARHGRPGPVWIDIPINIQSAWIDPDSLPGFSEKIEGLEGNGLSEQQLQPVVKEILSRLKESKRPVILNGSGVRISGSHSIYIDLIEKLRIPVVTAWNAHDVVWNTHPLYIGRPGTIGDRAGNFAVQNSDFLLILGCRLNIRQISYNWKSFARAAFCVMVDIDAAELKKPTLAIDLPVHADLKTFLKIMLQEAPNSRQKAHEEYLAWCKIRTKKYPTVLPEYWENTESVNPYCFTQALFDTLPEDEIIVTGDGTACVTTFQAAQIKKGQRLYTNSGCASMGFDLPAAIGAWFATRAPRITCIAGDGSLMMNLQELQTIVTHQIPAKIFVLNNQGYHSIRQTQQNYFPDNIVGCGQESGLSFPSFKKLADAFGLGFQKIQNHQELKAGIQATLENSGPQLCEVILDLKQQFSPKLSSKKLPDGKMVSAPLEDLYPFLPREELKENMLIPLWETET
ncbi:MAG: thiamine pyrophosphate-binding protein [Bdellovibrionia bacterium]